MALAPQRAGRAPCRGFGNASKPGVDVESVIRQYELSTRFPAKVVAEARRLGTEVTKADRRGRVDCRDDLVITIDPVDARDFDDAISVERIEGRRWRLWVHIADANGHEKAPLFLNNPPPGITQQQLDEATVIAEGLLAEEFRPAH